MTVVVRYLEPDRLEDARGLLFRYMAATEVEAGRAHVSLPDELMAPLRAEIADPTLVYRPPGALFLAYAGDDPLGCVGLKALDAQTAEVKRLFVAPEGRSRGVASLLMDELHAHAERAGFARLVLDVMPSRGAVIEWYRRLGYVEVAAPEENPYGMVFMERLVAPGR